MISIPTKTKRIAVKEFIPKVSEHDIQVACINWFRYQYPKYLIYAIPNGGARNIVTATKLKAEGVTAGVPDLHVPVAMGIYHGLYIEMKAGKNKASEHQITVMEKLKNEGYLCAVCCNLNQFMGVVNDYFNQK